jgi:hypothetical protein
MTAAASREDIEIGIARGWTITNIMRRTGATYEQYRAVREHLDAVNYSREIVVTLISDECGTEAGYSRHRRRKEPGCQPCREAHNAFANEAKQRRAALRPTAAPKPRPPHRPQPLDQLAIDLAVTGHPVKLTRAERREAVRRLTETGLTAAQVGLVLNITARSVQRHRSTAA